MFIETTDETLPALQFSWNTKAAFAVCVIGLLSVGFIKGLFEAIFAVSANF